VTEDAQTTHSAAFSVAVDHPALSGHFPGNPVVPGVVVLDRVISAAEVWLGRSLHVRRLAQAKFLTPLRPGEAARINLALDGTMLAFSVSRDNATIAKGSLQLGQAGAS